MKNSSKNSRREFIMKSTLAVASTVTFLSADWKKGFSQPIITDESLAPADDGLFKLPPLPYAYNALKPYIDAQTMEIHYSKHHQAYVDKLNAALEKAPELKGKKIEELLSNINGMPDGVRNAIRNQGGGHW